MYMLPTFPIARPADFQIFESDCKINPILVAALKQKFFETQSLDMEAFVVNNLEKMLTYDTASLYSWNGQQGYLPVMHFRIMKTLIGSLLPPPPNRVDGSVRAHSSKSLSFFRFRMLPRTVQRRCESSRPTDQEVVLEGQRQNPQQRLKREK